MNATFLEVEAQVRYWEDATVNGQEDTDGTLMPFRFGDKWCPVIRLADGWIVNWPEGTTADVHFKVCDQGEYWLATDTGLARFMREVRVDREVMPLATTEKEQHGVHLQDWQRGS